MDLDDRVDEMKAAIKIAAAMPGKFHTAISNPCFELWLLWHFDDHHAYLNQKDALRLLKTAWPNYVKGKRCDMEPVMGAKWRAALDRADAAAARIERNESVFPNDNPSSEVPALLRSLVGSTRHLNCGGWSTSAAVPAP